LDCPAFIFSYYRDGDLMHFFCFVPCRATPAISRIYTAEYHRLEKYRLPVTYKIMIDPNKYGRYLAPIDHFLTDNPVI